MSSKPEEPQGSKKPNMRQTLQTRTRTDSGTSEAASVVRVPVLTLLWHPDVTRVGERAWLPEIEGGETIYLSRLEPVFRPPGGGGARPLAEATLSREPLRLSLETEGLLLSLEGSSQSVEVNGVPLAGSRSISFEELARGLVLALGKRVVLCLQRRSPEAQRPLGYGLVGESEEMLRLRRQIQAVASLDVPVLLRGESGTGKELVAQALRDHSQRREGPFQTVNMAAVPPSLAASELFGAAKGAFSGADRQRRGYFERAEGGTLFLDEIGETPREVQALLLRALESGEMQPVGAGGVRIVDVRVLAATDSDLEEQVAKGLFSQALLQRLRGIEIRIPPLRERLEDFGRLFLHFLRMELGHGDRQGALDYLGPFARPFVPARLVARMARHGWPGNVRELHNEIRQLVVASGRNDRMTTGGWLEASATKAPPPVPHPLGNGAAPEEISRKPRRRRASQRYQDSFGLTEDEMVRALSERDWNVKAAAEALGVSRASLYSRMRESPRIRQGKDLEAAEIEAALEKHAHQLDATARFLQVSKQGLKRQMTRLKSTQEDS